jgi:large subunit ribosomal protein L18
MSSYIPLFRRKREGLTDYRVRKKAVMSREVLAVIRKTNKNVTIQFVKPEINGDKVISSFHSSALRKMGWLGSLKSTPACYLLGLYAGKKAQEVGIRRAVVYTGLLPYVRGSRISALVKGLVDSGLDIPSNSETFPEEERITGKFIADYAAKLIKENKEKYNKFFSSLLKQGFKPEEYPAYFEITRKIIMGEKR